MTSIQNFDDVNDLKDTMIAFGNFDGIHLGHKALIDKLISNSINNKCKSVLITFNPHTRNITTNNNQNLILDYSDKIEILKNTSLDFVLIVTFTNAFSNMSAEDFIALLIKKFKPKGFLLGFDSKFGFKGQGDSKFLIDYINKKKINISVDIFPEFKFQNIIIKSSYIKDLISNGYIEQANVYLGRKYFLKGSIIEGKKLGTKIGFPTANLKLSQKKQILPMHGVYYVSLEVRNKSYLGLCNVGLRPTFEGDGNKTSIETHLINCSINLYGERVKIIFLNFVREEIKFSTTAKLVEQINSDIKKIEHMEC